jgi:hypothetical protein
MLFYLRKIETNRFILIILNSIKHSTIRKKIKKIYMNFKMIYIILYYALLNFLDVIINPNFYTLHK